MRFRSYFFVIVGAAAAVLALVVWATGAASYQFRGVQIDPPVKAPSFQLTDQDGNIFDVSGERGNLVLVSFGYTNCQDVCPVTLAKYKRVRQELGDQAQQVRFILITVDPERDSPQRMREYLDSFDAGIIGLTGSLTELEAVWSSYNIFREKRDQGSAAGYELDHTSLTYLIDQNGNWRLTYPFEMDSDALAADLRHLLQEKAQ